MSNNSVVYAYLNVKIVLLLAIHFSISTQFIYQNSFILNNSVLRDYTV